MQRLFYINFLKAFLAIGLLVFSLITNANDLTNLFPIEFAKNTLGSSAWKKSFEDSDSEDYRDLAQFAKTVSSAKKMSGSDLAREVLKNPGTYKFKYQFLIFLKESPAEKIKFPALSTALVEVWNQIPIIYLNAIILMIEDSPVKEVYAPIIQKLKEMQAANSFSFIDLTPEVREEWAGLSNKLHISTSVNTLTKDSKGKYAVNGVYNNKTKVFAMDLSLSRDENLVTFAHEIVHIADPELIASTTQLQIHFTRLATKLRILFPMGNVEEYLEGLVQDTFMEQRRTDIASVPLNRVQLTTDVLKETLDEVAEEIRTAGYDSLLDDEDFKGFVKNLIAVSVENEYKAYVFSYALYSSLKDEHSALIPPSQSRDQFIQKHFDHPAKLQDILKDEAQPFKRGKALTKLLPQYEDLTDAQKQTPEVKAAVELSDILKKLIQSLYFAESKLMIERTTERFAPLYNLISRINFSHMATPPNAGTTTTFVDEEDDIEWIRPGGYNNSITNPYLLAEAKMGTASIIKFRENVAGLKKSIEVIEDELLTSMAGILPLNNLNFGELKWIGLMSSNEPPRSMPEMCPKEARRDMRRQDPEAMELFSRFIYNRDNGLNSEYITYDNVRLQLYSMQLYKAVVWLRKEFPITRENFNTLIMFQRKLNREEYKKDEISEERASELLKEISTYIELTKPRADELKNIEFLMNSLGNINNAVRKLNLFKLADDFDRRITTAIRYFQRLGVTTSNSLKDIESDVNASVNQLLSEISQSSFAKFCATSDELQWNHVAPEFNFGAGRKMKSLTMYCHKRQLYVLRLPCDWVWGATTSTTDPNGLTTRVFIGGRKILMTPLIDFREKK
jgi:hypothetical protein